MVHPVFLQSKGTRPEHGAAVAVTDTGSPSPGAGSVTWVALHTLFSPLGA